MRYSLTFEIRPLIQKIAHSIIQSITKKRYGFAPEKCGLTETARNVILGFNIFGAGENVFGFTEFN